MHSAILQPYTRRKDALPSAVFLGGLVAILLFSVAIRMWKLDTTDLWTDEILVHYRAQAPLSEAIDSQLEAGNQVPLYYMMMRLLPHETPLELRLPPLIFGLTTVALLAYAVTYLYDDPLLGLASGALLAVNPLHVILSRTARFYTLLLLLAVIVSFAFLLLLRHRDSRRLWIVFTVASLMAYMTHYAAYGLPAVQFLLLVLLYRRERGMLRRWFVAQVIAGSPILLWGALSTFLVGPEASPIYTSFDPALKDLPITIVNLLMGYDGRWHWVMLPGLVIGVTGLGLGAWQIVRAQRSDPQGWYWLLLAFVPVVALFVTVAFFGKYKDRYLIICMPALFMVFLYGWRQMPRAVMLGALAVVLATGTLQTLHIYHSGEYQRTDWSKAAAVVEQGYQPGDGVLYDRWHTYYAFRYAFDGDPAIIADSISATDADAAAQLEAQSKRIWAVYRMPFEEFHRQDWVDSFKPLQTNISLMSDWLLAHQDQIVRQETFSGVIVFLIDLSGE